ncbi:MAG: hypothetical protein GXO79_11095 [Chlorobi bacterium]|nr:hypothetical protein [Chlorobiota bacterium]
MIFSGINKVAILLLISIMLFACRQRSKKQQNPADTVIVQETGKHTLLQNKLDSIRLLLKTKNAELIKLKEQINNVKLTKQPTVSPVKNISDSLFKQQITQLRLKTEDLKTEKEKLQITIDSLNKLRNLNNKLLEEKNAALEKLKLLNNDYESTITRLYVEKRGLTKKLDSTNSLNKLYKENINKYNKQLINLNSKINSEQENKVQLEKQIAILQSEVEAAELNNQKKEVKDTLIEQNIIALKSEKSELNNLLQQANQKIKTLHANLSLLTDSLYHIKEKNNRLEIELQADKNLKEQLQNKYDSVHNLAVINREVIINSENMKVNSDNSFITQQLDSLNAILYTTNNKLNLTEKLLAQKKQQLNKKDQEIAREKELSKQLNKQKDSVEESLNLLVRVNDSLSKILVEKNENVKDKAEIEKNSVTELSRVKDSLEKTIFFLNKTNDSLIKKVAEKRRTQTDVTKQNDKTTEHKHSYFPLNTVRTKIKLTNKKTVDAYFKRYIEAYLKRKSGLKEFIVKEYFFFNIDTLGNIVTIEDQRTEFNKNTKIFKTKDIDSLKVMHFAPVRLNNRKSYVKAAIGIEINMEQTKYEYRLQKNKIRVYKTPLYVEYVEPGDKDYKIISDALAKYSKITNKFYITIIKGSFSIKEYSQKEYNPFDKSKSILLEDDILKITNIRGIR